MDRLLNIKIGYQPIGNPILGGNLTITLIPSTDIPAGYTGWSVTESGLFEGMAFPIFKTERRNSGVRGFAAAMAGFPPCCMRVSC